MSKAVLISIQPYWVFLIIAKKMGWNIGKEKTVEIRKNYPKAETWDKTTKIYCSRDKKSFARIPKEYQPLMERLLGKVIGDFICDKVRAFRVFQNGTVQDFFFEKLNHSCLSYDEIAEYIGRDRVGYAWHISDLVIYDKPRELSEFKIIGCKGCRDKDTYHCKFYCTGERRVKRPPQSWCYVEEAEE